MDAKLEKAFRRLGETASVAAVALGACIRAYVDAVMSFFDCAHLAEAVRRQAALNAAPTKVRHLALHCKKHRVRKKNMARALREYERSHGNGKA